MTFTVIAVLVGGIALMSFFYPSSSQRAPPVSSDTAVATTASSTVTSAEPPSGTTGAWVAAQTFVKRHLKNPSDADFGSLFGDFQRTNDVVTYRGAGKYHVRAWVDATNGFGGKIRTYFVCDLEWEPADKSWNLDNLSFDQ